MTPPAIPPLLTAEEIGPAALFLRPRLLGDVIFTIPALMLFRQHYPDVRVVYVTEPPQAEMARLIPQVDEVVVVDRSPGLSALVNFRRRIRRAECRVAVDFHSGPHSALLTRISGLPLRIGYRTVNRNWAYNRLTPRRLPGAPIHSVANQVRLLEHLGIPHRPIPFPHPFPIPPPGPNETISPDPRRVVLHVGAGNPFRNWGREHFRALARSILDRGLRVALIGHSKEERATAAWMSRHLPLDDHTGRLTIPETLRLIAASGVYVGVDSGPLHLAALTETPMVALYGPNIPAVSGPWRPGRVTILQSRLACRPCSQRRCRYDTIRCMEEITPHDVQEALSRYFR